MPSGVNFGQQQYSGFEPRMMPGCVMWLDGADSTSLTMSGNVITQWRDKSVNASVGTSVGSPTQTTINGLPAVAFNGSQYFDFGDVANLGLEQYNAFVVAKFNSSNSVGTFFAKSAGPPGGGGSAGNRYATYRWSNTNQQPSMASLIQTTVARGNGEAATTDSYGGRTNLRLFSFSWNRASNRVFVNGYQTGSRSYVDSNVSVTSTYKFLVGAYNSSSGTTPPLAGRYLSGVICEIILIFAAITPADFQQVESYLVEKWQIGSRPALFPSHQAFKYNSSPIVRPFQPIDDLTGPILWLDAADPTTITGSPVTQWRDKSGRGSNAVTGLGSVVAGTPINSLNTLRFGLNTTLNISNFRGITTDYTSAFYVFRGVTSNANTSGGTGYFIFSRTADNFTVFSGTMQFFSYQNPAASRSYVAVMGERGERNWGNLSTTAFANRVNVISTAGIDYASSNGLSLPMVASSQVINWDTVPATYQISTSRNIGDVYTYDLGELIVYNGAASRAFAQQIEGYLAWKWGVQGNLPSTHPYSRVLPSTPQFNPLLLFTVPTCNACSLWFDAADTTMITGTTQVTAWSNKGYRTYDGPFTGIIASNRVGSCTSGSNVNGLNYIRCPAGADLQFTTFLSEGLRTWFLVARQVTPLTSGTSTGLVNAFTGGAQDVIKIDYVDATTNNINLGAGTSVRLAANVPAATLSSPFLVSFVNGTSSNSNVLTINGVEQTRTTSTSATGYVSTTSTYLLGTAAYNTTVDLMEVILYVSNAANPTQRQRVEGYLAWKWGLQSNLPSTHAYAKFRP